MWGGGGIGGLGRQDGGWGLGTRDAGVWGWEDGGLGRRYGEVGGTGREGGGEEDVTGRVGGRGTGETARWGEGVGGWGLGRRDVGVEPGRKQDEWGIVFHNGSVTVLHPGPACDP